LQLDPTVKEVISVNRLRQEYGDKHDIVQLARDYDFFIHDFYISPILREALSKGGRLFAYDNFPIATKTITNLAHISTIIRSTYVCSPKSLVLVNKGRLTFQVGCSSQIEAQIIENVIDAVARLLAITTWENIECFGLSVQNQPSLFFYRCQALEQMLSS